MGIPISTGYMAREIGKRLGIYKGETETPRYSPSGDLMERNRRLRTLVENSEKDPPHRTDRLPAIADMHLYLPDDVPRKS